MILNIALKQYKSRRYEHFEGNKNKHYEHEEFKSFYRGVGGDIIAQFGGHINYRKAQ